jgi:hypothetical protein
MNNRTIRIPAQYFLKNTDVFLLLAVFRTAADASGWTTAQFMEAIEEALSSDDHHLRCTLAKYCVEPSCD